MNKVFIDAGHGGHDSGALGNKSKEKDNCLNIVVALGKKLKEQGYTVKQSRTTDKFLSLTERTNMANDWDADIFISVHNNSGASSATGFESYIYNGGVSTQTKNLQTNVHDAIARSIGTPNRGKKSANLAVVRQTKMSAVLIEYAFITNKQDEKMLINQVDDLSKWTAAGVSHYFDDKSHTSEPKPSGDTKRIKEIQKWVGSKADGIPGVDTWKQLTKKLQTELNQQFNANLQVDGIWGPKTKNAIVTIKYGAKGNLTKVLQAALYLSGYKEVGKIDGIYGTNTKKALGSFQKAKDLTVDHIAGRATFEALFD